MESHTEAQIEAPRTLLRVAVTLYVECGVDETAESVVARTKDRLNSAIVRAAVGHAIARVETLGNPPGVPDSRKSLSRGPVPSR